MFSQTVKHKAMVACGRRCCLCHKYCGNNMECAHINQKSKGGPNTFENCIPLCLDCHAEIGQYDDKHPKGIKFGSRELIQHRDRWYTLIKQGVVEGENSYIDLDKSLFAKIIQLLGGSRGMLHFRSHDYYCSYAQSIEIRILDMVDMYRKLPEYAFLTLAMELAFADFIDSVQEYKEAGNVRIKFDRGKDKWCGVPREWEDHQPERFAEAVKTMNEVSTKVWDKYSKFVDEARRTLKIDMHT